VSLAIALLALDGFMLVFALATITGIDDMSTGGIQVFGSSYRLDPPVFPWIVGVLSGLSLVAGWFASRLRRLPLALGVTLAWVALAVVAITQGSGPGLLVERLIIVAALRWGRRAFGGAS
jgi:hypothetical protein